MNIHRFRALVVLAPWRTAEEKDEASTPAFGLVDPLVGVRGLACVSLGLLLELLLDELNVVIYLEFAPAALLVHVADLAKDLPLCPSLHSDWV